MRWHGKVFASLALSAIVAACAADDLGPQYMEISEEESELLFYGPGLAGGFRQFLTGQDHQFVRRTLATYGPKYGEFPFARMYLAEAPPTRHFTSAPAVEKAFEQWGWFKNKTLEVGTTGDTVNAIGRIDFAAATADGVACVAWLQTFGPREDTGVGTRLLSGYYCKGKGPMMSAAEAEAIVKLIGHRKIGIVDPPADWTGSTLMRIQVIWGSEPSCRDGFDGQIGFPAGRTA